MQGQTKTFTKQAAKELRKTMTEAEQRLWHRLRGQQLDVKFRRQHPFESYVLDFVCIERRLVIEVDGSQHADSQRDEQRTEKLNQAGFMVLRFWNNEVLNETDAVVQAIWNALNPSPPQPSP
ncbi:endonuclease domain-containing protein [Herbaspirillum sp. LeCh32-8]|uniref:endonuclease domain-containing protein n=1 Tax=Herbaspirillum sp. LeCh32-8 TaxID=2821356 RepID=UPI001AEA48B7|nr:endonuclease domain-containing protein [Herbaspirillum sp. LeCh32-8]MBP0598574.1 endonuclease domain-containing protein [Herbaspirillum sp. LeCh32-8]